MKQMLLRYMKLVMTTVQLIISLSGIEWNFLYHSPVTFVLLHVHVHVFALILISNFYDILNYSHILIGSYLLLIGGQMHR